MSRQATVDRYAEAIAQSMPPLTPHHFKLVIAAYHAMLSGKPAEVGAIAAEAGWDPADAAAQLRDWPGLYFDQEARVIGFWGLTVAPISTHLVSTRAGTAWAWCALDPLFILPLLGESGTVAARSGISGTPVELDVTPDRATPLAAGGEGVYVSFLVPTGPFTSDVRLTFCDYVLFFDGRQSAERWTSQHPGTTALSLDEAAAIGRHLAGRLREAASSTPGLKHKV